jgi:hypothetical protein
MPNPKKPNPAEEAESSEHQEIHNEDFQFVLKHLLAAYAPILEEDLKRAKSPEELKKEAESKPASCEDEVTLANRIFEKFVTEEVAVRLLPEEGRKQLGPIENWRWCFLHIRCCIIFGWLLCRRQRTFRAFAYYLYRYWLCVRQVLGTPVSHPPTAEEREDFQVLVKALASAYKPYLTDQLASVEFPTGIPDEVIEGKIDCLEGEEEAAAIFERLLTAETAPALLGRKTFEAHSKDPNFWFCRCWCLCAIRFGCCLARARNFIDVLRCLAFYRRCLVDCFRPLICAITSPASGQCMALSSFPSCGGISGYQIVGSATGSNFDHYTLRYSWGGPVVNDAIVFPDCTRPPLHSSSNTPVTAGILGYIDATLLPFGITQLTVYVDVFDSGGGSVECPQTFELKETAIDITDAAKVSAFVAEDPFNPGSFPKLIKATLDTSITVPELSIGGDFSVDGSAYTIGCDRIMTQFVLAYIKIDPLVAVPAYASASVGTTILPPVVYDDNPSHPWTTICSTPVFVSPNVILNGDLVAAWANYPCSVPLAPLSVQDRFFNTQALALNGRYVIILEVDDSLVSPKTFPGTNAGVDQVAVWIDNQWPTAQILSVGGLTGCGDLHLKDYVGTTAPILGVAWDPPIDPTAAQQPPNDNFGSYSLAVQKNGDPSTTTIILPATPNTRVPNVWPTLPSGTFGTLANWDIATALDGGSGPILPGSPKILRGQRCAFVVTLSVSDTTHVGDSGIPHTTGPILYAVNVINDIGT